MKALLLPLLALAAALLGGAAAGDWLRADRAPGRETAEGAAGPPEESQLDAAPGRGVPAGGNAGAGLEGGDFSYLKFPQQFFVPIVRSGTLQSVMILDVSLELPGDAAEAVFRQESRLRDALLRALLIHANAGGFDGNFTAKAHMDLLRRILLDAARSVSGDVIRQALIGDIARQEQ